MKSLAQIAVVAGIFSSIAVAQEPVHRTPSPAMQQAAQTQAIHQDSAAASHAAAAATPTDAAKNSITKESVKANGGVANVGVVGFNPNVIGPAPCTAAVAGSEVYGFDATRNAPYVQTTLVDGSLRREFPSGVEIIAKDKSVKWYPEQRVMSEAQSPTPPDLPSDPERGRLWMQKHSDALKNIIDTYLRGDPNSLNQYAAREKQDVGTDVFKLIAYRTEVAHFYATNSRK
jgi:hypothetical protein